VNAAPAGGEATVTARDSRRARWFLLGVFVLAALCVFLPRRWFLNDDERRLVGFWYGLNETPTGPPYAWIAEFREDGTMRLRFRSFGRINFSGVGSATLWTWQDGEESGRWRVKDGVQRLVSEDPEPARGLAERLARLLGSVPSRFPHEYRILKIDAREMSYLGLENKVTYHSLHARRAVPFPTEPLPPEQWAKPPADERR